MGLTKLKKFINDHILGTVITALGSLATVVGGYLLIAIKTDLDHLQCRITQFAVKNEYKSVQLKLIVTPLDDVDRKFQPYKDLISIISDYRSSLEKCPEGKDDLAQIVSYRLGLESFFDRDWEKAIGYFGSISDRTALTEKSMANALLHKYTVLKSSNDSKADEIHRQWLARIAAAHDLAMQEADYSIKERAVAYLGCNGLLVEEDADGAISCLNKLIGGGLANYNVYYNLAALYSRKGSFDVALRNMELCMNMSGARNQRRSDIEADPDFKAMFKDTTFGPRLKQLIAQLQI